MTGSLTLLKSQNPITVMLNITPLTVNLYFLGKSIFFMLTVTSDNSFLKFPPKSLTNSTHGMVGPQKSYDCFSSKIITDQTCHVNITLLTVRLWCFPGGKISTCQFSSIEWQVHSKYCYVQNHTSNCRQILVKLTSHLWSNLLQSQDKSWSS